jgi:tRNA(Met) cytidine acetyltransferase
VQAVFERAADRLKIPCQKSQLSINSSTLVFVAVDELIRGDYSAELLLIDEAAAIPSPMLAQLLTRFKRIVFASTVHGYEGTGRGFEIRFRKILNEKTPQWRSLTLSMPIRWAENDPVESWLFDALLLKADPADDEKISAVEIDRCVTERLNRDELVQDKALLSSLFGLLVQAHYQTSPDDLRNMLDGPNISVWVTRYHGLVVAAALVADEGGFDESLATAIWQGERRPRGHLIPQTLACHNGFQQAPLLRYQRVMRIAVHPLLQRKGVGQRLMAAVSHSAKNNAIDFVGASFAATDDVASFWKTLQCQPVRLGISRDASSGCYSVIMLSALSVAGSKLLAELQLRFVEQFYYELPLMYRQLESELVILLLQDSNNLNVDDLKRNDLTPQDYLDIQAFVEGHRQLESCRMALSRFLRVMLSTSLDYHPDQMKLLDAQQKKLLVKIILQAQSITEVAKELHYSGKKELIEALRSTVSIVFYL